MYRVFFTGRSADGRDEASRGLGCLPYGTYGELATRRRGRELPASGAGSRPAAAGAARTCPSVIAVASHALLRRARRATAGRTTACSRHASRRDAVPMSGIMVVAIPLTDVDQTLHHLLLVELLVAARRAARARAAGVVGRAHSGCGRSSRWARRPARSRPAISRAASSPPTSTREVGRLGLALNSMLGQIEVAFAERTASEARLRRFVADASHELRTPLTSIRGYAELFRRGASTRPDDLAKTMTPHRGSRGAHGRARRRPPAPRPARPGPAARTRAGRPLPVGRRGRRRPPRRRRRTGR